MQIEQYKLHADIEDHHWWFRGRRSIMRALALRILAPGTGSVIDVGCGTGANLAALAEDYHVLGIDASSDAIAFARERFPKVDFVCDEIPVDFGEQYPSPRLFLLMDVLEHVPNDVDFFRNLISMLVPGDTLLLTVPAKMSLWSKHDVSFGHYRRYDISDLPKIWSGLPVKTEMLSYFNTRFYPIVKSIRVLNSVLGKSWGEAGTDLSMPLAPINRVLERTFAGEARTLLGLLDGRRPGGYRYGVSVVAVLRAVN
jgi:SAM-dependent methyltransferase